MEFGNWKLKTGENLKTHRPYDAAQNQVIAAAHARDPNGVVVLPGTPFEVRFGVKATSKKWAACATGTCPFWRSTCAICAISALVFGAPPHLVPKASH